jgi:hypothetical protein
VRRCHAPWQRHEPGTKIPLRRGYRRRVSGRASGRDTARAGGGRYISATGSFHLWCGCFRTGWAPPAFQPSRDASPAPDPPCAAAVQPRRNGARGSLSRDAAAACGHRHRDPPPGPDPWRHRRGGGFAAGGDRHADRSLAVAGRRLWPRQRRSPAAIRNRHDETSGGQAAFCAPRAAISRVAVCAEEAGFWPVISRPSCTVNGAQSGPLTKLPPLDLSMSSTR